MIRKFAQVCCNAIYSKTNTDLRGSVFKVFGNGWLVLFMKDFNNHQLLQFQIMWTSTSFYYQFFSCTFTIILVYINLVNYLKFNQQLRKLFILIVGVTPRYIFYLFSMSFFIRKLITFLKIYFLLIKAFLGLKNFSKYSQPIGVFKSHFLHVYLCEYEHKSIV